MAILRIKMSLQPQVLDAQTDCGGDQGVRLSVHDESGREAHRLMDLRGGANEIRAWLRANRDALVAERVPCGELGASSIAEAVAQFYARLDPNCADKMVQRMYDYRKSHSLRFALRGTDIGDIYLGLFGDGYEVSMTSDLDRWQYKVDLLSFLRGSDDL